MADRMKKCSCCGKYKPFSEFAKDSRKKYGLDYRCRECISKATLKSKLKSGRIKSSPTLEKEK